MIALASKPVKTYTMVTAYYGRLLWGGVEPDKVEIGMKVKAVFAKEATSTIRDIDHFEPV